MATTAEGATAAGDPGVRGLYHGAGRESPKGNPPPPPLQQPSASPRDCVVPTPCLRRACNGGETRRAPLPPPPTPAPQRAGNAGRGGAKSAYPPPPPPEGNAAGWGGRGRRVGAEPHDRARRGRAPCKPRRGDHRGRERRVEGATTGAARHTPPPPAGGRKPRLVPATGEQRREYDKAPPPPTRLRPPKGGGCRKGGADSAPPTRGQSGKMGRQRGEGAGRTTRPCPREASAEHAPAGGAPGERTHSGKGDNGGHAACPTP